MTDHREREQKWQRVWKEQKAFEPEVHEHMPKFMCTFPYPYVNGLPHVGHLFTMMRVEAFARYKRMRGFNVLFPQGWHCTGSPLVAAAKRVNENEPTQLQILRDFGVPEDQLTKFTDPDYWITYFVPNYKRDIQALGMSIDWRREFITSSHNPRYDAFIRWQFKRLKELGYIALGKHPVVWCPKEEVAVSDHDRREGEGETPQEYVLIYFTLEESGEVVPCATLRPETIDGVTNIWMSPTIEYIRAHVDGKPWILSREAAAKLSEQEHKVHIENSFLGKTLIGKTVIGPSGASVPILPASFPKADKGTGVVMSVPADSPDDYIALRDLQHNEKLQKEYNLSVSDIKVIPIIDAGELGHTAAVKVVEDMKIQNQNERDRLEQAKKLVYKKGFYEGVMLSGDYKGEKVEVAKEKIKHAMIATKQAELFYELSGPVVCRCLTACIVKVVQNQWFITYSNPEWKAKTHAALAQMEMYPPKAKQQFTYVIDWLHDRACARTGGLGTRLPWDEHWVIESLSDSTFYNTFYTFTHKLNNIPESKVTDALFDYVLLGKGSTRDKAWDELKREFDYWYPVDFRNSGKDLVQNHLTFMLFTHTALLPEDKWPRSYGVNGFVTVDGKKMSKSLGNVIPVRSMLELYGADASRLTILNGGEGIDDPNWDSELAKATTIKLDQLLELCHEHAHDGARTRHVYEPVDEWFASVVHRTIADATDAMERANYRTAIQTSWFELGNAIKRYRKLSNEKPHAALFRFALEAQLKLIQPFTPHAAAEGWALLGNVSMLSNEPWPQADENLINPTLEATQDLIEQLASDIRQVTQLLKKDKLEHVTVIVASEWLYEAVTELRAQLKETRDVRTILPHILRGRDKYAAEITKLVPTLVRDFSKLPRVDTNQAHEFAAVKGAAEYLGNQFGANFTIERAEDSSEAKAKNAFPGKPALVVR